jgi:hypothetical protein
VYDGDRDIWYSIHSSPTLAGIRVTFASPKYKSSIASRISVLKFAEEESIDLVVIKPLGV